MTEIRLPLGGLKPAAATKHRYAPSPANMDGRASIDSQISPRKMSKIDLQDGILTSRRHAKKLQKSSCFLLVVGTFGAAFSIFAAAISADFEIPVQDEQTQSYGFVTVE